MFLSIALDADACSGTPDELTAISGTIRSPGYSTSEYPDNSHCQWRITAPFGKVSIILTCYFLQQTPTVFENCFRCFSPCVSGHCFYRAMLCIRGTSHGPVSVCVFLSQVGVLLKRLNVGSHKQHHTIVRGL